MDPIKRFTDPLKEVASSEPIQRVTQPLKQAAESAPAKKVFSLAEEFKQFAFKGNVIDLAIGVIIGAAFGKVVDGLVKNVIMPFVGVFMPAGQGYRDWKWVINGHEIAYGLFLSEVVNFLVVSLVLFFFLVKFLRWLIRARTEEAPPPLTKDQELLTEIRDLLKQRQANAGPQAAPAQPGEVTV